VIENKTLPMGMLAEDLAAVRRSAEESNSSATGDDDFVFNVQTHAGRWKKPGVCRDDRDLNQHFLRPAAIALGIYRQAFGFHAFRREAVTEHARAIGQNQAQRMAGHALHARGFPRSGTIGARSAEARSRRE
jgi:hypothetical protein